MTFHDDVSPIGSRTVLGTETSTDWLVGSSEMASGMVGSSMGPWTLAIDFGTSFTVAAVRLSPRSPEVIV